MINIMGSFNNSIIINDHCSRPITANFRTSHTIMNLITKISLELASTMAVAPRISQNTSAIVDPFQWAKRRNACTVIRTWRVFIAQLHYIIARPIDVFSVGDHKELTSERSAARVASAVLHWRLHWYPHHTHRIVVLAKCAAARGTVARRKRACASVCGLFCLSLVVLQWPSPLCRSATAFPHYPRTVPFNETLYRQCE